MSRSTKWLSLVCVAALASGWVAGYAMRQGNVLERNTGTAGARGSTENGQQLEQALFDTLPGDYSPRAVHDFFEILSRMSPPQISSVVARVQQLPDMDRRSFTIRLISGWAEIDAPAALQGAFSLDPEIRTEAVTAGLGGWTRTDSEAAQKWALSLAPGQARNNAIFGVVSAMIDKDPAAALLFVRSLGDAVHFDYYHRIFTVLAEQNPASAGAQALSLPEGQYRGFALSTVVKTWAQTDPAAALAWTARIPEAGVRQGQRAAIYEQWAKKDPAGAHEGALAMPDDEGRDRVISCIVTLVSAANPPGGAELAMLLPPGPERTRAMGIVAGDWAGTDLRMTLDWIAQTSDDKARAEMVESAMRKGMESDPRVFVDYLLQGKRLPDRGYQSVIAMCASMWANRDADAALEWARQIEDEKVRGEVMGAVIAAMSIRDPVRAGGLLGEVPARRRSIVVGELAANWTKKDPAAATAWAMQLPGDEEKRAAVTTCAATLAEQDSPKAIAWLNKLPAGPLRDMAIIAAARQLSPNDPEAELAWLVKIAAAEVRTEAIKQMAWNWFSKDKSAARRWLTQTTLLDEAAKEGLLRNN